MARSGSTSAASRSPTSPGGGEDGALHASRECAQTIVVIARRIEDALAKANAPECTNPTDPGAYLFPNSRGGRMARQRVARIVKKAARLASERLVTHGLPPLPVTTPHSLRRTYVSIVLLANNFDVMWVMSQVGHADSKMTSDVYTSCKSALGVSMARPSTG